MRGRQPGTATGTESRPGARTRRHGAPFFGEDQVEHTQLQYTNGDSYQARRRWAASRDCHSPRGDTSQRPSPVARGVDAQPPARACVGRGAARHGAPRAWQAHLLDRRLLRCAPPSRLRPASAACARRARRPLSPALVVLFRRRVAARPASRPGARRVCKWPPLRGNLEGRQGGGHRHLRLPLRRQGARGGTCGKQRYLQSDLQTCFALLARTSAPDASLALAHGRSMKASGATTSGASSALRACEAGAERSR